MAKLNLTNADRMAIRVDFSVNRFVAVTQHGALIGCYSSKSAMKAEFRENGIRPGCVRLTSLASRMYLANYGDQA